MDGSSLLGLGSLFTSAADIAQAAAQHTRNMAQERAQHEEEMRTARELHAEEIRTARQTYLLSAYTELEQYCQELNENLLDSTRDAERDMVDQRNQQFQTLLIAATMMLTALLSVLYQGIMPKNSSQFYFIAYSLTNTASLLVLLVCVCLCLVLTSRVHRFMYRRSCETNAHMTAAMEQTRKVMRHIRGDVLSLVHPREDEASETVRGFAPPQASSSSHKHNSSNVSSNARARSFSERSAGSRKYTHSHVNSQSHKSTHTRSRSQSRSANTDAQTRTQSQSKKHKPFLRRKLSFWRKHTYQHKNDDDNDEEEEDEEQQRHAEEEKEGEDDYYTRKKLTRLVDQELEHEWAQHEEEVHKYLQGRSRITELRELLALHHEDFANFNNSHHSKNNSQSHHNASHYNLSSYVHAHTDTDTHRRYRVSFEKYWNAHCHAMANWALVCFYLGTTLMLLATLVYVCASFFYSYHSIISVYVSLWTLGASLFLCLGLAVYLRFFDASIKQFETENEPLSLSSSEGLDAESILRDKEV